MAADLGANLTVGGLRLTVFCLLSVFFVDKMAGKESPCGGVDVGG